MFQEDNEKNLIGIIVCALITIIIFVTSCWDSVDPTYYGLLCSKISKQCDQETIYSSGRHFVGPFSYFLAFPGALQTIEFTAMSGSGNQPLKTRTAEGLGLTLYLSFQYQLIKDEIPKLYSMNSQFYEQTFVRIARDTILQAAGSYDAPSYWTQRKKIGDEMRKLLDQELSNAHARCIFLQILKIDLPEAYEDSIVVTQVEVQNRKMKEFEQQAQMIIQSIDVLKSETEMAIKEINATAMAQAYNIKQNATAYSNQLIIESEANAYKEAKEMTGLDEDQLNEYIYYVALIDKPQAKLLVGMQDVIADLREN